MAITEITWDVYQSLRDYPISHPDVTASMAERGLQGKEPAGGWLLGHAASWGRRGPKGNLVGPITAQSSAEFENLAPLTTSVALFGINWGGKDVPNDPVIWQNFHTPRHPGDSFLARSLNYAMDACGVTAAPYMSDVFKLIPTPSSKELVDTIRKENKAGRDPVGRCADILRYELDVCTQANAGVPPVIVGLGKAAYRWLAGLNDYDLPQPNPISEVVADVSGTDPASAVVESPHYTFGAGSGGLLTTALMTAFHQALSR